jgi:hypothetical protein
MREAWIMSHIRPLSAGIALGALLAAATSAAAGDRGPPQGLLAELPADAPPGDCYAHVRVRGREAPPQVGGAVWVQTPGPPGAPGPIWCLVPTASHAPPPMMQEGWIRVVCDRDVTPDRVRSLQRHLHDRGFYQGPESGEYDRPTADAVGRFQRHAHIDHGGYLSLETWEALNGDDDLRAPPQPYAEQRPLPQPPRYEHYRPETDIPPPVRHYERPLAQQDLPPPRLEERNDRRTLQRDPPPAPQANVVVRRDDVGGVQRYYSHQSYSRSSSSVSPPAAVYGGGSGASYGYGYGANGYASGGAYDYDGGYASGYGYAEGYGAPMAGPPVYAQPQPAQPYPNAGWRPPYAAIGAGSAVQNGYLVWSGKTRF